ncbi:MAG: hypothetical protein LBQ76_01675 [Candidatus Fibromonas sp.]|jgi:hypothetical protein|nr:hypothetical protein [Candidatus Fibromonas sp.]
MVIIIIVAILLLTAILAVIGIHISVNKSNKEKETEEISKIAVSGKYSVALRPATDSFAEKKPAMAEIEEWLHFQSIGEEQKKKLLEDWQQSINQSIKTINEGDINGVTTYRIALGPKDKKICGFLHPDHFITREQISRNADILPPYCLGSDSTVVPKLPWEKNDGTTSGWKAVLPKNGGYDIPEWRQIV